MMTTRKSKPNQGFSPFLRRWLTPLESDSDIRLEMIESQIQSRGVVGSRTINAMLQVPRHVFLPGHSLKAAYSDRPLSIGHGQTISQPYIVALMTSQFEHLPEGSTILEIGSGCGYQTAILVKMGFEVHSMEIVPELVEESSKVLLEIGLYPKTITCGDGRSGFASKSPFYGIVSAACAADTPQSWLEQLQEGGVIISPIGTKEEQHLIRVDKGANDGLSMKKLCPVRFVPLV